MTEQDKRIAALEAALQKREREQKEQTDMVKVPVHQREVDDQQHADQQRALTVRQPTQLQRFTPAQRQVLKNLICKGASDDELDLFEHTCTRLRLDPFARQIYGRMQYDSGVQAKVLVIMVAIDGYRLNAERTGEYMGQVGPEWCGKDGKWREIWLEDEPPAAARVKVLRSGRQCPWVIARYRAYVQTKADGNRRVPTQFWDRMSAEQLAKCAEALALRKMFPNETSGTYTPEEMPPNVDRATHSEVMGEEVQEGEVVEDPAEMARAAADKLERDEVNELVRLVSETTSVEELQKLAPRVKKIANPTRRKALTDHYTTHGKRIRDLAEAKASQEEAAKP